MRRTGWFLGSLLMMGSLLLLLGCDSTDGGEAGDGLTDTLAVGAWESLNFGDRPVIAFFREEPYLYAAAGDDGVWRKNIRELGSSWEALGPEDSTQVHDSVRDLDVHGEDVLAASTTVGVWRSLDAGQHWVRSDTGIRDTVIFQNQIRIRSSVTALRRAPDNPSIAVAAGGALFQATDGGMTWTLTSGIRQSGVIQRLEWHPRKPGEVWVFWSGQTGARIILRSLDYGRTWGRLTIPVLREALGSTGGLYSVAFDAAELDVIYAVETGRAAVRSDDGGETWSLLFEGRLFDVVAHPALPGVIYVAADTLLLESTDYGETVRTIEPPEGVRVYDLLYDVQTESIYVSGRRGEHFRYKARAFNKKTEE